MDTFPNSYDAPKPTYTTYTKWQWASYILARIFFPPILLWDALKFITNKLVGGLIGFLVLLPANDPRSKHRDDMILTSIKKWMNSEIIVYEDITVITHDRAVLNGIEFQHQSLKDCNPADQNYIINFVGNASSYESILKEMADDASNLNCNVVGFNFRGVKKSSPGATSSDQLVFDGIAQVQRLLDKGVHPENITLKAYSLGAGIATLVAHHFHQQGKPINLFNDRSFSSITNILVGKLRVAGTETGHSETMGRKIIGWLAKPWIWLGVQLSGWEIDAGDAFLAIPKQHREHIVARSTKKIRDEHGNEVKDDLVIPHYASLHEYIKGERSAEKYSIDFNIAVSENKPEEVRGSISDLEEKRAKLKENKMQATTLSENAHRSKKSDLVNRSGKSADTFFKDFVKSPKKRYESNKLSNTLALKKPTIRR